MFANSLMSLNRYSATFISYQHYWTSYRFKLYFGIFIILSFLCIIPTLIDDRIFELENEKWIIIYLPITITIHRIILCSIIIIKQNVQLILGYLTILRLRNNTNSKNDKNLVYIIMFHSLADFAMIIYHLFEIFAPQISSSFSQNFVS
ncbi:unnamed protein product [Caenorhabditis angaria]|uniref:Serpentine receptor class gamma n=1 Tax=Caenorhabditis angaria TaxID=860376 RepID=A0A9P1MWM7_9PELO|nr:unnamed protein product [Caenorhabditis angaria]